MRQVACGRERDVAAAREHAGRERPGGLVHDAAHGRVDELLPQHPQAAVVQRGDALGVAGRAVPISQQTIVTPASASISVAMRSGSPT